jgi:DNA processing protein
VIAALDQDRVARAVLTYVAEPEDQVLAALLRTSEPVEIVRAVARGRIPAAARASLSPGPVGQRELARMEHAFGAWRNRLSGTPSEMDLAGFHRDGIRLVCPGDAEWPTQLDVLADARPYALWLRGEADLRYCCLRSVSVVGSRAATAYGSHVGTEMAAALAERGWTVVSGGAYGIDGCGHTGALAADGVTVAVLACGVDYAYPRGHQDLFAGIAAQGVLVSEWPPGRTPSRRRFLIRNRVIGALSQGTVVVEAGLRSGALNTARHARDLGRPVMAVPGPVTSDVSAGCHKIIREWGAVCVTSAHDVIELLAPLDGSPPGSEPVAEPPGAGAAGQQVLWPGAPAAPATHGQPRAEDNGAVHGQHGPSGASGLPTEAGLLADSCLPMERRPPGESGPSGDSGPHVESGEIGLHDDDGARARSRSPVLARDALDKLTTDVLEAVPVRGAGPATIAVSAGLGVDAVMRSLGLLAAGGFVERCPRGWRVRRPR